MKRKTPIIKRVMDIALSALILIVCSPIILIVGLITWLSSGGPIFFYHQRPGKDGKLFKLVKIRSMVDQYDQDGKLLPDSERITSLGSFIRRTSIDELPEFYNVLRGDMSLVGPRPLLKQYIPRYSAEQARRHEVLPGVTGWAQVNGRNTISWDEKFKLDIWYVDNWTFWLDVKIIFMTIWKVLTREGISQPGRATMDEFKGNEK